MVTRCFHEGSWCQYLTAHPVSSGEVFVHRVCHHGTRSAWRLHLPYILTLLPTVKHIRTMLTMGRAATLPNLEPEVMFSISWGQTVLESRLGSLLDRKPLVALTVSQNQIVTDRVLLTHAAKAPPGSHSSLLAANPLLMCINPFHTLLLILTLSRFVQREAILFFKVFSGI